MEKVISSYNLTKPHTHTRTHAHGLRCHMSGPILSRSAGQKLYKSGNHFAADVSFTHNIFDVFASRRLCVHGINGLFVFFVHKGALQLESGS